jgi:nitroreductase
MTNAVIECILSRSALKYYDPAVALSDDQIRDLVRTATTAPTSFHLQNRRFIAVHTPEAKARLRPIAWDQPATTDAAVTFIVCGHFVDSSVIPAKRDAAVQFARKAIETRSKVSDADLKVVHDAGYTDANVMEVVTMAPMYSLTNFFQ